MELVDEISTSYRPCNSHRVIGLRLLARLGVKLTMDNTLHPANAHKQRCPRCQSLLNTVVVHGHEQCVVCKSNIFECCSGDTCETDHNLAVGYKRG